MTFLLHTLLADLAARRPDAAAVTLEDDTISFAELQRRATHLASGLRARGVAPGDRVALLARNSPVFFELTFACSQVGAAMVGLNWRLSAREIAGVLADADPALVICDEDLLDLLPAGTGVVRTGQEYVDLRDHSPYRRVEPAQEPHATVVQLYSSGTTGLPKGIMISQDNLTPSALSGREMFRMDEDSVNLVPSPLFHIGGLGYALTCLSNGGETVLVREAGADHLLAVIERRGVTHMFLVPAVLQSLVDSPRIGDTDLSSFRYIAYGGAPMSPALLRRAHDAIGTGFIAVYGMTETSGTVLALPPEDHADPTKEHLLRSVGKPLPWAGEVALFDPVTLEPSPTGQVGEIWVRSSMVTPGYWRNPTATAETIRDDGWLRSGDAAYRDEDGYFYLHDRFKDMIISGGENVFPAEVEAVLADLDGVAESAVIGVASERWGETVKAFVVAAPGADLDQAGVIAFCRANLAHYKCPTIVEFVADLPRNASGKLLKHHLRERNLEKASG